MNLKLNTTSPTTKEVVWEADDETIMLGTIVTVHSDTKTDNLSMNTFVPDENSPLKIETRMSFGLDPLVDLLEHVTVSQFASIEAGEPINPSTLHPDLQPWLTEGVIGQSLKHPLVFEMFYNPEVSDARINVYYKYKVKEIKKALIDKEYGTYVFTHERAYRLPAFMEIEPQLSHQEFCKLFAHIWIDSDNIFENFEFWKDYWADDRLKTEFIMDEDDLRVYNNLPTTFPVYRGTSYEDSIHGLSWTLDRNKAIWFAKRFGRKSILATAIARRKDVLAYFDGRGEREIVIFPEKLKKLKTETLEQTTQKQEEA